MNQNLKKWLLSGIIFLIFGIITISLILFSTINGFNFFKYLTLLGLSILTGYIVIIIINKISINNNQATYSSNVLFATYSTIITIIITGIIKIVFELNKSMAIFIEYMNESDYSMGFFVNIQPIAAAIIIFLGINLIYGYNYFKLPEKRLKEIMPHIYGIIIIIIMYLLFTYYLNNQQKVSDSINNIIRIIKIIVS